MRGSERKESRDRDVLGALVRVGSVSVRWQIAEEAERFATPMGIRTASVVGGQSIQVGWRPLCFPGGHERTGEGKEEEFERRRRRTRGKRHASVRSHTHLRTGSRLPDAFGRRSGHRHPWSSLRLHRASLRRFESGLLRSLGE